MDHADLSLLRTKITNLAEDLASSGLHEADLKDLKLPEDFELKLRLRKGDKFMKKAKAFLDSCDGFLEPLASMSRIAAPLYGGLKCIVTIAAAKAEILDEVIDGLNEVLKGLPLIKRSKRITKLSNEESCAIISAIKEFVGFMQILRGVVGKEHESVIKKFKRMAKSESTLGKLRAAREKMQAALSSAHYETFISYAEDEQRRYILLRIETMKRLLHCTNYDSHFKLYLEKSQCIENPCAWSKSHPFILDWLETETSPKLFISGKPGTGKSVLAAHMIDVIQKEKEEEGATHRGVLLYYFCGADPAMDQYSDVRQETSSKAILMTLLRQIVLSYKEGFDEPEVLDYVLASGRGMLSETWLRKQVANLLKSFDTIRIIIDLDHCEKRAFQQDGLIPWILNITHARILLIGRQYPHVASLLAGLPTVTLGSDGTTQSDLEAYARHVVQIYIGSDDPDDPDEAHLVQSLVGRSENMFQYIFLVENLSHNSDLYDREERVQILNNTPPGIFGMYKYYLAVQLQQFSDSGQMHLERVLEILLQFLTFSPSPVTPLIFLQALQLCPSIQRLKLNPETDDLAIRVAKNAAGVLFDVRETATGIRHLVPVHRTLSEYFLVSGGNQRYDINGISLATREALVSLHNAVTEAGPKFLLELCCNGLRNQDFNRFLHQYQEAADFCRQNKFPQQNNCDKLQAQLWQDPAFSICDSLAPGQNWMDRQWNSLKGDGEWFTNQSSIMEDYNSRDNKTLAPGIRHEIYRWNTFVFPCMKVQLECEQKALSELQTRHLSAYAFRNTIFYLHLTRQKITNQYPSSPSFEGLIMHCLDQLENILPELVQNFSSSESSFDSTISESIAKSATMICGLERLTRAIRALLPTRKSYPRQLLGIIRCLWATGSTNLDTLFTTEEIWAREYYSELLIPGFNTNSIHEKLIRHTLERVLLYLADAERICFTDLTQFTSVGNLCFRSRQLRQAISHHLLFQIFHPTSTSIRKGSLVPEFIEHEPGFTNIVLLHNAVIDIPVDRDSLQPSTPKTWIFLGVVFLILGFILSRHTCFIFSLFSAPPVTTHGLMRQASGWSSIQLAASAGVIGCFCDRARAGPVMISTIPCALGVFLVLISPQFASSPLVKSIGAISTDHLMFLSVVPLLLVSAHEQGFWTVIESTAVLYVIIRLFAFALDRNGMKRKRRDLARIGRKYKRRSEEKAGVHRLQISSGLSM